MTATPAVLDLSPGAGLVLDGEDWTVESVEPQHGQVLLRTADGQQCRRTIRWVVNHPRCRSSSPRETPESIPGRQPVLLDDLTELQRNQLQLRVEHALEAATGYRSGNARYRLPGEPRPDYDPNTTTKQQRREAKVAELARLSADEAHLLGLDRMSDRSLRRLETEYQTSSGLGGCIDGRNVRRSGGHPCVSDQVREAIFAVRKETLHRSRISMKTREHLVHQYVRETFGPAVTVPSYSTLRRVWQEWFGPGGGRQKYVRSANAVETSMAHVVVHRPGQVVALDTTILPVKVREGVFGDAVSVHLTWALDTYTHSLVAFRLTLVSDTSVDVAMLLRDMMMPLPMRPDWSEDMAWPYPGVPAEVVADFAGYEVAGLPFFAPETVTTDHGSVYKNHHLVEVQRTLGCNILPARTFRPTDKHAVERAFGAARSLLFENLLGYQGVDVADRGADPEVDAVLTVDDMEHLVATWIVKIWQNRRLTGHAPAWGPGEDHSPNTLFAAAMSQGGFALQVPQPQLYYQLLPAHHVKIHGRRGVKIAGLWYDGPALDAYRDQASARGGRHKGKWTIHRDKRDRRTVYFQSPDEGNTWNTLRWTGLPLEGEVPAFSDARVSDLLREARTRGLVPKSDGELLPVLLELLGARLPVATWPTQMSKQQRREHAREANQAQAATTDRPDRAPRHQRAQQPEDSPHGAAVVPDWAQRSQHVDEAIDAERRRRREHAVPQRPAPPPRLGEAFRHRNLFLLPDADELPPEPTTDDDGSGQAQL